MSSETTVSLPEHLQSVLIPLPDILPSDLRERLSPYLAESVCEIPHLLLSDISRWARTEAACSELRARQLEPSQYTMIALLAGTITSPSSKFPPYLPPEDLMTDSERAADERKTITAMMNALFSIGGAGYASWWASGRTNWRDEWRVLFALLVASVLAVSESILYLIWQSRRDKSRRRRVHRQSRRTSKKDHGSNSTSGDEQVDDSGNNVTEGLRKRQQRVMNK